MDQVRIGSFLKELRKEKNLTQEQLAECFGVSNRTISRWETGNNMPDIGMLVEIADFYEVSIPEIIDGKRKSRDMETQKETVLSSEKENSSGVRETAASLAEYSRNEVKTGKQKILGYLLTGFGIFIIISALAVFPNESSWGSIYSVIGSMILLTGAWFLLKPVVPLKRWRILCIIVLIAALTGVFAVTDYLAVTQFNQVPRFSYVKEYSSENPDEIIHRTLFFTAVQKNPGTEKETVEIERL